MAEPKSRKRELEDTVKSKGIRPPKRPKNKQRTDPVDSEDDDAEQDFKAVDLADSDSENLEDAEVDDGQSSFSEDDDEYSDFGSSDEEEGGGGGGSGTENKADASSRQRRKSKSKRNDPDAFATSISKILNTKLSTSRRADPVLARSAEAQEASRKAVDSSLDAKARKQLRDQKRLALEKGRVRDVLVASNTAAVDIDPTTGEVVADGQQTTMTTTPTMTTAQILETERRLRKVAQRGVVKLFNAVRAAQVKASEAERAARAEGVVGMGRRQEKITEMTRQGFLDLLASGGGGLKKGPLEEG